MISRCSLNRRLAGPHSHTGCLGDAGGLILSPGIEPRFPGSPLRSSFTTRLRDRGSVVTRSCTHFQAFFSAPTFQIGTETCRKSGLASTEHRLPHPLPGTTGSRRGEMKDCLRHCSARFCHVSNRINADVKGRTGWMQCLMLGTIVAGL